MTDLNYLISGVRAMAGFGATWEDVVECLNRFEELNGFDMEKLYLIWKDANNQVRAARALTEGRFV